MVETDRTGREIPDREYTTKDFERVVALRARTNAIAAHLTGGDGAPGPPWSLRA